MTTSGQQDVSHGPWVWVSRRKLMIYVLSISGQSGKTILVLTPDREREYQLMFPSRRLAARWLRRHRAQGV